MAFPSAHFGSMKISPHSPFVNWRANLSRALSISAVLLVQAAAVPAYAADDVTKSALETDPQGWVDILPPPDLSGWARVPYRVGAKITRQQWHVDNGVLTCDGDGGHDMLLLSRPIGNSIFHVEFCFKKIDKPKAGYNSGVFVRTLLDGSIWHQAQVSLDGGYFFGVTPAPTRPPGSEWRTNLRV